MSLDLITSQFAFQGDQMTPPQTSTTGFVNFLDGYTKDYEISLGSGNPQAKAVERQVQNYLFGQSTAHQLAWEQQAFPPWFSSMPGGYKKNAVVIRQTAGGEWKPYRSLVAANIDDPLTTPDSWEYQPTAKDILANVPMPSGAGTPANEIIATATDFNTLKGSGTWEFLSDAVVSASSNRPVDVSGMLEAKTWRNGTPVDVTVQRYLDVNGQSYTRAYNGSSWTAWRATASILSVRNDAANWCSASMPTANNYVLVGTPVVGTRVENLRLMFRVPTSNTSAVTIDDGNGPRPLVDRNYNALSPNALVAAGNAEITWNSTVGGGSWILHWCDGAGSTTGEITPVGAIQAFAMNIAPAGWLVCDGSAKSRVTYADLFAKIGTTYGAGDGSTTFNLPDLRAEFIRGWDNGRGVDTGRTFGSSQIATSINGEVDSAHTIPIYNADLDSQTIVGVGFYQATNNAGGATVSARVRPRNVAMLYCIKAFSAVVNPGQVDILALLDLKADRASFANLKARPGWQALENGMILQWGSATVPSGTPGAINVALPIAFPNAGLAVFATSAGNPGPVTAGAAFASASQITLYAYGGSQAQFWFAIGY